MLAPHIEAIKQAVGTMYHTSAESLQLSRRGVDHEPRNVALYITRRLSGKKLEEIGREFGVSNYSTVSSALCKISKQVGMDKTLQGRIAQIEDLLLKSQ